MRPFLMTRAWSCNTPSSGSTGTIQRASIRVSIESAVRRSSKQKTPRLEARGFAKLCYDLLLFFLLLSRCSDLDAPVRLQTRDQLLGNLFARASHDREVQTLADCRDLFRRHTL